MNKIEQMFFDAWNDYEKGFDCEAPSSDIWPEIPLEKQTVVGIYKVDFTMGTCAVEIDGHETHKTKEQRYNDYQRERFLQKKGYTVVRFMGSEVFLDPLKCVMDVLEISNRIEKQERNAWFWENKK